MSMTARAIALCLAIACDGTAPAMDAGTDAGMDDEDACGAACAPSTCRDGLVDDGEQCDDGNEIAFDGCDNDCTFTCEADDECNDGDPCSGVERCVEHACASGTPAEDGALCTTDDTPDGACRAGQCAPRGCGDGVVSEGESCEDGNTVARDGCENDCRYTCEIDEAVTNAWYLDCDGDGFASGTAEASCLPPPPAACGGEWTLRFPAEGEADCDDTSADIRPDAEEICDGIDNDCAGGPDDGLEAMAFFADDDGDGFGDRRMTTPFFACEQPDGYVTNNMDCFDANPEAHPGATGFHDVDRGDGVFDYDCDGRSEEETTTLAFCNGSFPPGSLNAGWCMSSSVPICGELAHLADGCNNFRATCAAAMTPQRCR